MLLKFLIFALLAVTASALNLPGIPQEFTEDDEVLSAISGRIHILIFNGVSDLHKYKRVLVNNLAVSLNFTVWKNKRH